MESKNTLETLRSLNPLELAIGSGVTFPIQLDTKTYKVWDSKSKTVQEVKLRGWYPKRGDLDLIKHNIESALVYPLGFRLREEEYGNNLEASIEEPNTQKLRFFIRLAVRNLVNEYEGRVRLKNVQFKATADGIAMRVHYSVIMDNPLEDYMDIYITNNT